jgi:hypothetical protein
MSIPPVPLNKDVKSRTDGSREPMAHTCNPSYSGGRAQEDHISKLDWVNSLQDPISKIPRTKKGWWSDASGRAPV